MVIGSWGKNAEKTTDVHPAGVEHWTDSNNKLEDIMRSYERDIYLASKAK